MARTVTPKPSDRHEGQCHIFMNAELFLATSDRNVFETIWTTLLHEMVVSKAKLNLVRMSH